MGYVYDIFAEKNEDKIKINLFEIDENKKISKKEDFMDYSILVSREDYKEINLNYEIISSFLNYEQEEIVKIKLPNREEYEKTMQTLKEQDIEVYEKDLNFELAYLIWNQKNLDDKERKQPFKEAYIDIETLQYQENKIISISIFSENLNKVWILNNNFSKNTLKSTKKYNIEIVESEEELIKNFLEALQNENFNLILGWNVVDFDFKILYNKCKKYNIPFQLNNFGFKHTVRVNKDFFRESKVYCPGTVVLDVINLLRINNIYFSDYKLETVATEVLGEAKHIFFDNDDSKGNRIESLYNDNPSKLIEYNYKDSELVHKIVGKLNLLELVYKKTLLANVPIFKINSPIAILDVMYLKQLHERRYIGRSIFNFGEDMKITGAYVVEPEKGFHNNVLVFDFKSLYPSIIMTFNIDPFTYSSNGSIKAPNNASFVREQGILPKLIHWLYTERNKVSKKEDPVKNHTLKIIMNSFYGAMGSPKSRFYNMEVAEAITTFSHYFIKLMKKYFEEKGYDVIYGDTDSLFVKVNNKEAIKEGEKLNKKANEYLDDYIKKNYKLENKLKLEFEKCFTKFFIASKKRYVGKTSKGEISFTGLEAIRSDWTELSQEFQKEFIEKAFKEASKEELIEFIKGYIENLRAGKYDNKLVYKKKITKPLNEYIKTTPPHVKAARQVSNFKGNVVEYVITKDGPVHKSLVDKNTKFDYEHYIHKQLKAVIDDFLKYLEINFEDALGEKRQSNLSKFF